MNQPSDPGDSRSSSGEEPGNDEQQHRAFEPSRAAYAPNMRECEDTTDQQLHPRFWEAQLEAARRGSLRWGFAAFLLGYGGYYLVGLVLGALLPTNQGGFDPARPPNPGPILLLSFAPNIMLGLLPALYSWIQGKGLRSDFGILPKWRDFKVGLACGAVALFASWVLTAALVLITGPPPDNSLSALMESEKSLWLFLFALFTFIGAPLTEELLMRGALWGALEHYRVPRYVILLLTALIFALIHGEMWRMPVLFVGGLAMGTARMITGRVSTSIVAHATNNFLPALVLFASAS